MLYIKILSRNTTTPWSNRSCKVLLNLKYCTWINYSSIAVIIHNYTKVVHKCLPSAANTMLGICYLLWYCVAVHMGAVLCSTILHAVLCTTQLLKPLYSPTPDWLHTSQHNNNNNQTQQLIPSPLGAWLYTKAYPRHNRQVLLVGLPLC